MFNEVISHCSTGWPIDHGPTNVRAMVKIMLMGDTEYLDMCNNITDIKIALR